MKKFLKGLLVLVAILVVVFFLGPRPEADQTITFSPASLGQDLDSYLQQYEANFTNLNEGAEKEIVWADPSNKGQTDVAVLYIHGFSATKYETRPLADNVASALNANLFYTRLNGHGSDGESMAKATMNAWVNDMAEAVAIGERLGKKILILATSTGATLSTWAAASPELNKNVAAIAMVSPNFEVQALPNWALNMPWAETLLPLIPRDTERTPPVNPEHEKWWTRSYPPAAVFPMAALLRTVENIDHSTLGIPAMFVYSTLDQTVRPDTTEKVIGNWGGPKSTLIVNDSGDRGHHVIAGDIRSPGTTKKIGDAILEWFGSLN